MYSFEELDAWKAGREFKKKVKLIASGFPKSEEYKLKDQIFRSSRSVTANIAEGFGRFHHQENIQFCRQARGSLTETLDHLIEANDCGYISKDELDNLRNDLAHVFTLLTDTSHTLKEPRMTSNK